MLTERFRRILMVILFLSFATAAAAGREVHAAQARRIVSLVPSVTETLFALGAGSEVVGVSEQCDHPPAALKLPRVGSFLMPNVEAIAALRPTSIIGLATSANLRQMRALRAMGYPLMTVSDGSLEEITNSIALVGNRIGRVGRAHLLVSRIRTRIRAVQDRLKHTRPVKVVMFVGHQPLIAVGSGTFLAELLRLASARNIAAGLGQAWPRISLEYVIATRPDVILDGQMGTDRALPGSFWNRYSAIPAVRNHRVYGYPPDPIIFPGPRVARSLEIIAALIHPEAFRPGGASRR